MAGYKEKHIRKSSNLLRLDQEQNFFLPFNFAFPDINALYACIADSACSLDTPLLEEQAQKVHHHHTFVGVGKWMSG